MRFILSALATLTMATAQLGCAGALSFTGNFSQDDDVQLLTYSVQNTGMVSIFTTSFATGGFGTELALFDENGMFLFSDDGTSSSRDSSMVWNSLAGKKYWIALTQYDNYAIGPNLSDGFTEKGNGNFTGMPPFNPPQSGSFLLPGPIQRTSQWALTIESSDPTLTGGLVGVPEPGTVSLCLAGIISVLAWKRLVGVS